MTGQEAKEEREAEGPGWLGGETLLRRKPTAV